MRPEWNHNLAYHEVVLSAVPEPCGSALDVGCGDGALARRLAGRCGLVTGIDLEPRVIANAMAREPRLPNVSFEVGDILSYRGPAGAFTFVCSIATLHHLPLEEALIRLGELVAPGGVLAIIGLYRAEGLRDAVFEAAGALASWCMRRVVRFQDVTAPMTEPRETLAEIERAARFCLPGSRLTRRLFFRYSLRWRKPSDTASPRSARGIAVDRTPCP